MNAHMDFSLLINDLKNNKNWFDLESHWFDTILLSRKIQSSEKHQVISILRDLNVIEMKTTQMPVFRGDYEEEIPEFQIRVEFRVF